MAKMHADEVDTDVALVGRLLGAQFPHWAGLPLEPVGSAGTDSAIYRLDEDLAVRLPRIESAVGQLEKDRRWLPALAPHLPLAIPVPLEIGEPGEGYPFTWGVYRWLEGDAAIDEPIVDLAQAATDLARFVGALQRIDASAGPAPGEGTSRGVPLARRDAATRAAIADLASDVDVDAVTAAWDAALAAPVWDRPPVWIHGDLDARNLLVTEGRLSAVIDFGSLGVGDPAADVMVVWKMLSPETRGVFRTELAVDDATWARSRGWAVSQALIALAYYTVETNPVLVTESRRWLAAVLADQ